VEKAFGCDTEMTPTIIIKCTKCGGLMLAGNKQKTKKCPYCGTTVSLQRAQHVAAANTAREASELLRKIKSKEGFTNNL
jgi:predicted  nucleic acid-binding Zn-ribbon protein